MSFSDLAAVAGWDAAADHSGDGRGGDWDDDEAVDEEEEEEEEGGRGGDDVEDEEEDGFEDSRGAEEVLESSQASSVLQVRLYLGPI